MESTYQFLRKPPSKKITTFLNFGKIKQAVAPNKHPGNNLKNLICALNADSNFYGKQMNYMREISSLGTKFFHLMN